VFKIYDISSYWHKPNTLSIIFNHVTGKKNFYFRGCGWPNKAVSWCAEDKLWITAMNQLFESLYGKDTLKYKYVPGQGTKVQDCDNPIPVFYYDHKVWEENYASYVTSIQSDLSKPMKSLKTQLDMCPLKSEEISTVSLEMPLISQVHLPMRRCPLLHWSLEMSLPSQVHLSLSSLTTVRLQTEVAICQELQQALLVKCPQQNQWCLPVSPLSSMLTLLCEINLRRRTT